MPDLVAKIVRLFRMDLPSLKKPVLVFIKPLIPHLPKHVPLKCQYNHLNGCKISFSVPCHPDLTCVHYSYLLHAMCCRVTWSRQLCSSLRVRPSVQVRDPPRVQPTAGAHSSWPFRILESFLCETLHGIT